MSSDELEADEIEDADEPGIVGDKRGWAVSDSLELVRGIRPPCALPIEVGGKSVSRLLTDMLQGYSLQVVHYV